MKKTNKIILAFLVVAVIAIGIGYASLNDTMLEIKGAVDAQAVQTDFKVVFTGDGEIKEQPLNEDNTARCTVTTTKTSDTVATFSVSGLHVKGEKVEVEYTIQNNSTGIVASNVRATTTSSHTTNDYIETIVGTPSKTILEPGDTATVKVTTIVTKTPLTEQSQTVGIQILATPIEEGA